LVCLGLWLCQFALAAALPGLSSNTTDSAAKSKAAKATEGQRTAADQGEAHFKHEEKRKNNLASIRRLTREKGEIYFFK
jgi:hypothetical protein